MGNCCKQVKLTRDRLTVRKRRRIVLLVVGLDNSGKTATIQRLLKEGNNKTVPTVGFSVYSLSYRGYTVVLYDLGGGPQIRDIWSQYYVDVHGIVFLVDASDPPRVTESASLLQQILTDQKLKGKPLLLLANKQDIDGALDEIDVVERLNLEAVVNEQKCPTLVETCCAIQPPSNSKLQKGSVDPGIQNGFRWILNIIMKDFLVIDRRVEEDMENAQAELAAEKECRKKRVEEQRRQREEMEGTIIIPLRDSSPDSSKSRIITVQSTEVTGIIASDSQDSGVTVQNGEADKDKDSLSTVQSRDSAVQSMKTDKVEDSKPSIPKKRNFMKRSNKTVPVDTPESSQSASTVSKPTARHRLPPLTPPPNHVKMFEVKSSKRARFVTSTSLSLDKSESDLTDDERSLNLVSFPSDWKLLRHLEGKEETLNDPSIKDDGNDFGKTFIVSKSVPTTIKENDA